MTLAAAHVSPVVTIPAVVALAGYLLWLWLHQGRPAVPTSRRRVRRTSIAIMLIALPPFVRGMSFIDPVTAPRDYVVTWTVVIVFVVLVLLTAGVDVVVSVRLHRTMLETEMLGAAEELAQVTRADAPTDDHS